MDNTMYKLLFETASEGFVVANSQGEIVLANKQTSIIFGYEIDELKQMKVDDLLPKHLRNQHIKHRSNYNDEPRKRPMGAGYDLIGVRKDGTSVPIEISLNHYTFNDELMVIALIMDVTIRKENEAQINLLNRTLEKRVDQRTRELNDSQQLYKLIARNFPNGTINVFDKNLNYIFVEGEELYKQGITSENLVGKNYLKQLPSAIRPAIEEKLTAVMEGKNLSFEQSHQNQHYLINAVGLMDNSGHIDRILLVEQNITSRIEAEQKVLEAFEKERQLNELKSRFVSMASHEFRTPLSTVLSSLSLIEKYDEVGSTEKKIKHYQRIRGSVRHLTSILNDFLSLEKVETDKVSVNSSSFNVLHLIQEIIDQHKEMSKQNQRINLEFSGSEVVITDQNMLRIIMGNLLSNAIKYSNDNANIWVNLQTSANTLILSVRDEGIGIPYEDQIHMFERFFRAKNALNLEGTGLGLNIVHRYAQLLNGTIEFDSVPTEGTTFTLETPININHA